LKTSVDFCFSRKERKERIGMAQKANCCLRWCIYPSHPNGEEGISFFSSYRYSSLRSLRSLRQKIQRRGGLNRGI
ncbi:MAG: hypothetical protein IJR99_09740, partial [Kiritimatiellae bacterium]|nr:hypothetical protein [Kiritimatiellia bacterium]